MKFADRLLMPAALVWLSKDEFPDACDVTNVPNGASFKPMRVKTMLSKPAEATCPTRLKRMPS